MTKKLLKISRLAATTSILTMATFGLATGATTAAQAATATPVLTISSQLLTGTPGTALNSIPEVEAFSSGKVFTMSTMQKRQDVVSAAMRMVPAAGLANMVQHLQMAMTRPKGGWGSPLITDAPTTKISIMMAGKMHTTSVYAMSMASGKGLTAMQMSARKMLNMAVANLKSYIYKTKGTTYMPSNYVVNNMTPMMSGSTSTGIANPAAVFCTDMGGTETIVTTSAGEAGNCVMADGTSQDEWAYYRAESPMLAQWPASLPEPMMACQTVSAMALKTELMRTNPTNKWLMPSGHAYQLELQPVLPGMSTCKAN